jgi:2-polyprenyl-3-methyl-5-hydroxy-6-metoxy-1,4-benzoquinol methylase
VTIKKTEWDKSYENRDNFVFYPHEEVIRFVSKFIRKKVGLAEFRDVASDISKACVLNLGCGIGRHVIYCHDMGLEAYGVDLSDVAVEMAREWGKKMACQKQSKGFDRAISDTCRGMINSFFMPSATVFSIACRLK